MSITYHTPAHVKAVGLAVALRCGLTGPAPRPYAIWRSAKDMFGALVRNHSSGEFRLLQGKRVTLVVSPHSGEYILLPCSRKAVRKLYHRFDDPRNCFIAIRSFNCGLLVDWVDQHRGKIKPHAEMEM